MTERDRSKFLGGSDAAAVMGLSPWSTPLELWQEKTGRKPPRKIDPAQEKRWARGKRLEPVILEMLADKLTEQGLAIEIVGVNRVYQDERLPFLACEIDFELIITGQIEIAGEVYDFDREHINGDCKSVHGFARKKWGDENSQDVPIEYAAQFMHGLGITGRKFCIVAALIGLDDVAIYWVVRDDETIDAMREKQEIFWNAHVLADVPPDPLQFDDIKLLFPMDNGQEVEATAEVAEQCAKLDSIKRQIKQLEEVEGELKFNVAAFISPHAILKHEGRVIATWKAQQRQNFDAKQFREDHPSMAADYTHHTPVRVLLTKKATA